MPLHPDSGRAFFSKGMLGPAKKLANQNVALFSPLISAETPLVGLEPSAILGFRDEYPRLVPSDRKEAAQRLGVQALMIEEFLVREMEAGRIDASAFTEAPKTILLHGHCHQKALAGAGASASALGIPKNFSVELLDTGCCGMAGSFGYEKEHIELSMQVGELTLFPKVRSASEQVLIAAPGTSCRHQILDGTGRKALHPVTILYQALRSANP